MADWPRFHFCFNYPNGNENVTIHGLHCHSDIYIWVEIRENRILLNALAYFYLMDTDSGDYIWC